MNELIPVTREDFTAKVRANPEWKSEAIEAPWISTMLYLDADGAIVARARYTKNPHSKVTTAYELGTKVIDQGADAADAEMDAAYLRAGGQ